MVEEVTRVLALVSGRGSWHSIKLKSRATTIPGRPSRWQSADGAAGTAGRRGEAGTTTGAARITRLQDSSTTTDGRLIRVAVILNGRANKERIYKCTWKEALY